MKTARRKNFAEVEKNRVQQDGGNRGRYANVGYLANAAGRVVMSVGVGVRSDLQQKEKGEQRKRNDNRRGQPATRPGP
ncbi:MAG TPA: hypothetical protein VK728_20170 [Candidatus Sulfotelmatobacter sp.]|nr:hypothetical protein [Candidatus Sulfotelmatobacter sp.]